MALPKVPGFVGPLVCAVLLIGAIGVSVPVFWNGIGNEALEKGKERDPRAVRALAAQGAPNYVAFRADVFFLENGFLLRLEPNNAVSRVAGQQLSHKKLEVAGDRLLLTDETRDDEYDPATGNWKNLRTVRIPDTMP